MTDLTYVVMAKRPEPGRVNTRLVDGSHFDARAATDLAWSMLGCVVRRLAARGRVVLACTPDGSGAGLADALGAGAMMTIDQGPGDLGRRLDFVWRTIAPEGSVAFFGMDSPDVPASMLAALEQRIHAADIVIGPSTDGGYWTLAASAYRPQVLRQIDWGSRSVYDQTCRRARDAGLSVSSLPAWPDIDRPQDVFDLATRLEQVRKAERTAENADEELRRLADRLDEILSRTPDAAGGSGP